MTLELVLFIGGGLVPVLTWSFVVLRLVKDIHKQTTEILEMHRDTTSDISALRRGIPELIHYQRWVYKAITKSDPPPFVGEEKP